MELTDKARLALAIKEIDDEYSSPDELRQWLYSTDVRGEVGEPTCCPLANALFEQTGHISVWISKDRAAATMDPGDDDWLPLPAAMRSFVEAFDEGQYPELVAQGTDDDEDDDEDE
jgi:hypothetical protein